MTKEEMIELAKQAGIHFRELSEEFATGNGDGVEIEQMQTFAKLVIEHERGKYTKLYEEEIRSIREAATQYGIPSEDAAGMLLFCEEFARMVAEKEREACAKACEEVIFKVKPTYCVVAENCVKVIRARGQE
jgi:hypothetical protein